MGAGYRGGALNMAARLCSLAEPGQVLATEGVTHLARKVEGTRYPGRPGRAAEGHRPSGRVIEVVPAQRGDALLRRLRRRRRDVDGDGWWYRSSPSPAIALAAALVLRGGADGGTALAALTKPHTIAAFDTRTGKFVKTISSNQDEPQDTASGQGCLDARARRRWSASTRSRTRS